MAPLLSACRRSGPFGMARKTTFLIFAFEPQYASLRSRVTLSPRSQEANLYGPVPTGCSSPNFPVKLGFSPLTETSSPYFFRASGLAIANDGSDSAERKLADG